MNRNDISNLSAAVLQFGHELTSPQIEQFDIYLALLRKWNPKINLTGLNSDTDIVRELFADSLALLPYVKDDSRVMDLGSGNGCPGIPLKIVRPSVELILVEARAKRVSFINEVIRGLTLKDAHAIHARAEDKSLIAEYQASFDAVAAKAVAKLDELGKLALPYLKPGGCVLAMKGPQPSDEIDRSEPALREMGFEILSPQYYELPPTGSARSIVILKST